MVLNGRQLDDRGEPQQRLRTLCGRRYWPVRVGIGATLGTVVGVLVKVPVMLSVVRIVTAGRGRACGVAPAIPHHAS